MDMIAYMEGSYQPPITVKNLDSLNLPQPVRVDKEIKRIRILYQNMLEKGQPGYGKPSNPMKQFGRANRMNALLRDELTMMKPVDFRAIEEEIELE